MKRRIKLNNKKSHFPLPLGEGRISTQGTSVRNSGEGKSFTKALSVAALAGLTFFGAQANAQGVNADDNSSLTFWEGQITGAAADINPADYLEDSYGTGNSIRYFKFEQNSQGNYEIKSATSEGYDFSVNYNSENPQSRLINIKDISSQDVEGSFINLSSDSQLGVAIENTGNNAKLGNITADLIDNSSNKLRNTGIIYNGKNAYIESICNNTISNKIFYDGQGGVIYNEGTIDKISGLFVDNYTNRKQSTVGTIHGEGGIINSIDGTFIGNHVSEMGSNNYRTHSNTLALTGTKVGSIKGTYIGNYVYSGAYSFGAVLRSFDTNIQSIDGTFIGNYVYGANNRSNYGE